MASFRFQRLNIAHCDRCTHTMSQSGPRARASASSLPLIRYWKYHKSILCLLLALSKRANKGWVQYPIHAHCTRTMAHQYEVVYKRVQSLGVRFNNLQTNLQTLLSQTHYSPLRYFLTTLFSSADVCDNRRAKHPQTRLTTTIENRVRLR